MITLIIDDERPARAELRRLLAVHPQIEIIGEAENAASALSMIDSSKPALIFLDIQMPGQSGFDLVAKLPVPAPKVIFTTAYDQHAVRAFEVNATDYLLKPIEPGRLASSLARLDRESDQPQPTSPLKLSDRVLLRSTDRSWFVAVDSIRLIESVGNYSRVHFANESPLIYRTLNALEGRLPAPPFFRANRSQIINTRYITSVEDYFAGGLCVTLKDQAEKVEISRRRAQEFRQQASL